jgi:hypothetical protein
VKFHLVKLGSRPLLAVPCGKHSLWAVAIDCYPAHTGKKRLVRKVLHGLAGVGLIRWVFPARELSLPGVGDVDFEAWVDLLGEQLHLAELQPVLVWPADPLRGRVYMYLLDKQGEKVGFCKLGLDAKNNALINRERQALEHLQSMELKLSRIPKLLAHGELDGEIYREVDGGSYLVVEMTPVDASNIDWQSDVSIEANIAEYAGSSRVIKRAEVETLNWWSEVTRQFADRSLLMDEVDVAVDQGIEVCLAHGDLNCTNVLKNESDDEVWLLDWEQSDHSAPILTDLVCVAVDKLWLANAEDTSGNLQKFKDTFIYENDPEKRAQIILALAYLSAAGFPPALAMMDAIYAEGS